MTESSLDPEIISLLEEACNDGKDNFEIVVHGGNDGGQGYLGELVCRMIIHVYTFSR